MQEHPIHTLGRLGGGQAAVALGEVRLPRLPARGRMQEHPTHIQSRLGGGQAAVALGEVRLPRLPAPIKLLLDARKRMRSILPTLWAAPKSLIIDH